MRRLLVMAIFAAAAGSAGAATAAGVTHLVAGPGSKVVLEGSSNVAQWRCTGTTMTASMDVAAPIEKINDIIDRVENGDIGVWMSDPSAGRFPQPAFDLVIPIATFRCTGGNPMLTDMKRSLHADSSPDIRFLFKSLRSPVAHDIDAHSFHGAIVGQLSLAGKTRDIDMDVEARRISSTRFRLMARLPLLMSDFGIKPPTALFGMIKASDSLAVRFALVLIQSNQESGRSSP